MFLLGRSERVIKQLNKDITAITIDVAAKASTDASGTIRQVQNTNIRIGKGGSLSNTTVAQTSKMNLSAMQKSDINAAMTSKMAADIAAKIEMVKPGIIELGNRRSRTDVQNIVERNVSKSFSSSALATLSLAIDNAQNTNIDVDAGGHGTGIAVLQSAEAVGKVANEMSTKIVDELVADTKLQNTLHESEGSGMIWIILLIALVVIGYLGYREYKARMRVGGAIHSSQLRHHPQIRAPAPPAPPVITSYKPLPEWGVGS